MRTFSTPVLLTASLAALLWLGIGLLQRTRAGADLASALVAELPLTLLVLVLAGVLATLRRSR
ncbi:hypothetical protein [Deinococcus geothermalis]|uniref:hypothetical protein n=1 Tax=Deinococcus geothermalis TaxID=68909 RepID=UPI0023576B5C|nr:hypothetical protein [Deinococcus geothermalis]